MQRLSTTGQPMWDLVKTRHGKKHFVKAIKVSKDYGLPTALASLTVKAGFGEWSKKMSQIVEKVRKEGGGLSHNKNVHNSKCRQLWDEGRGLDFQIFPKFKWLKYGLDFDNIWLRQMWDIGQLWFKYGWYMIEIVPMNQLVRILVLFLQGLNGFCYCFCKGQRGFKYIKIVYISIFSQIVQLDLSWTLKLI